MNRFDYEGYAKLLKDWVAFSQKHLYYCPERPELICYGAGENGHWGVHTHQKAFSAFAILATSEDIDLSDFVITRQQLIDQALGMLRYNLHTHVEGDFVCTNGRQWGHNWIYALGIERMFHGVEALEEYLTEEDKDILKKVILSECDFILNEYDVKAGLTNHNKPESNIWNGAILYRAAVLYPDCENKDRYIEKGRIFLANGLSIESDENSDEIVDGHRIGDLFVGANMFNSFACNHHGYLNIGYMNICLSNIAMLHFFLKSRNIKADDILYHNLKGQWDLMRSTTFNDGRLLRIGGDSRARYCYCQDYALPTWALIEDVFDEDCSMLEDGWLKILQKESSVNGDGSFLSNRFGHFENLSPVYYTRLETDRSNVISMILYWHRKYNLGGNKKGNQISHWTDEYHGSAFVATGNRYASFTWRSSEKPQGLLCPQDDSSLAEWRYNLTARIFGVGRKHYDMNESEKVSMFEGGFLTYGTTSSYSDEFMAEGQTKEIMALKHTAFAALPDDNTILCIQYMKTLNRCFSREIAGTYWNVPNDIFNGRQRKINCEQGCKYLRGGDYANNYETIDLGSYVNVDEKIGLASKLPLTLVRRGYRQVDIKGRENSGTLYAEEICAPYSKEYKWLDRGQVVVDTGFAMGLGDTGDTKKLCDSLISPDLANFKTIGARGKDNNMYVMVYNYTEEEQPLNISDMDLGSAINCVTGEKAESLLVGAGEAVLLRF